MSNRARSRKTEFEFKVTPRTKDLPATQGMLYLVQNGMKANIRELRAEMQAGFSQVDARFSQMDSKFERVLSEISRVGVLVEEQNSRNQIVLEGLTGLWQRQQRVEDRVDDVEKLVRSIGRAKS